MKVPQMETARPQQSVPFGSLGVNVVENCELCAHTEHPKHYRQSCIKSDRWLQVYQVHFEYTILFHFQLTDFHHCIKLSLCALKWLCLFKMGKKKCVQLNDRIMHKLVSAASGGSDSPRYQNMSVKALCKVHRVDSCLPCVWWDRLNAENTVFYCVSEYL